MINPLLANVLRDVHAFTAKPLADTNAGIRIRGVLGRKKNREQKNMRSESLYLVVLGIQKVLVLQGS